MKRAILTLGLAALLQVAAWAEKPKLVQGDLLIPNIYAIKNQIKEYVSSGRYNEECQIVASQAQAFLAENLPRWKGHKMAMVLDIDETSLSNYSHIKEHDFGYIPVAWEKWILEAKAPAIQPTLELFRYARQNGLHVFFITGRTESERQSTVKNLQEAGYGDHQGLVLKAENSKQTSQAYKQSERRKLEDSGYHIVVNVGDQMSDLEGGYSEAVFKLPNPMYWVP